MSAVFGCGSRQQAVPWSKPARVKRFFQSEVGAAVAWVAGSLVLAAVVSPWLFQAGKHLAFTAEVSDMPAFLEWLGDACGRAKFGRYFNRAMLLSALFLLPVLFRRIRILRSAAGLGATDSWSRLSWSSVAVQIVIGCVVAGGMLWGLGAILEAAGAYVPKPSPPVLGKLVSKVLIPAVAASLLEEWLLLGICFWREAREKAIGQDRTAGKRGLSWRREKTHCRARMSSGPPTPRANAARIRLPAPHSRRSRNKARCGPGSRVWQAVKQWRLDGSRPEFPPIRPPVTRIISDILIRSENDWPIPQGQTGTPHDGSLQFLSRPRQRLRRNCELHRPNDFPNRSTNIRQLPTPDQDV